MSRNVMTEERLQEMRARLERGDEVRDVAAVIGCTPRCIYNYAKVWGIPVSYRLSQEQEDEIRFGLEAGDTYRTIAARADCSIVSVEKRAIALGLTRSERRRKLRKRSHDAAAVHRAEVREEVVNRAQRSKDLRARAQQARLAALSAIRELVPGYDGTAHGKTGLVWPGVPRQAIG